MKRTVSIKIILALAVATAVLLTAFSGCGGSKAKSGDGTLGRPDGDGGRGGAAASWGRWAAQ